MTDRIALDGRVAVVTGAGGGLGAAYARALAERGAKVVVNDVGSRVEGQGADEGPAEGVAASIRAGGHVAVADVNTVATPEGGAAIVRTALDHFGRIDILVNNAGIIRRMPFGELDLDALDAILQVNLLGSIHVARAAWPEFVGQSYGRIVNTTSAAGVLGNQGAAAYGSAKAGIVGLTRVLALEGAAHGIKANALAPRALTRMTPSTTRDGLPGDRLGVDGIAPVVVWLAHETCTMSGEVLSATGGHVARFFTGLTQGHYDPELTPESVRDNIETICRVDDFLIPKAPADELEQLRRHFGPAADADGGIR